ncbi:MAG: hypothetical protein QX198_05590 [Methylococcaceae bacterium]
MEPMTEEQRRSIIESSPVGTFALMSAVVGGMVLAWLFLYYGVFLPRG